MFGMPGISALVATSDRSFVIAAPAGNDFSCVTRLYRFTLDAQGRPGRLSPLGQKVRGHVWSLAASVRGQVIGYAVSGCAKGQPGYLAVLDARTGRTRQWSDVSLGGESPGNVAVAGPFLSMSANGRMLAFAGWDVAGNWHLVGYGHLTRQVVRALPTGAASMPHSPVNTTSVITRGLVSARKSRHSAGGSRGVAVVMVAQAYTRPGGSGKAMVLLGFYWENRNPGMPIRRR